MKNPNVGAANGTRRRPGMEGREAVIVFTAARIVRVGGCNFVTTMSSETIGGRFDTFSAQFGTTAAVRPRCDADGTDNKATG
ncbi:hypothetical protein [Xanthomonas sp. D-109]|uniref:hypothetical protein n=1 Tax=Xanthomonas sp. D-109 TaxID=2821274 RepID=UPI001ADB95ED|nr:hypothetical protein [Xanthomonas sp. D-109]MBO9882432.1 hypothetical protein [Xanthomonas sp. D-109]